uniref:Lysosome-associated membrane glycoprotein 1 n=1 Tax=Romanomermis culicivorax TaxID=13658 RepID=A0A915IGV4_ROMCU
MGGNSTVVVQIPPNAEVVKSTSTCGYNVITATSESDEQVIQLKFKIQSSDWFLTLNFTNNSILAHIPIDQYPSLAYYARLDYVADAWTFVNVSKPNEKITLQNLVNKTSGEGALSLFKSDTTHFYRCNGEEKTLVVEGFEIWTKSLRVEAFLNNSTTLMKERVCLTDQQNETSDLVPIITGAALAALVFFVLIAYLVGRARARANTYETI